jgi:hypothetical protein
LPDLSGLVWVEDDLFIGVHDAKRNAEKYYWPRVSLVRLPKSEMEGVTWPVPIENVEATEVCRVGRQLVFLYAERAEGLLATKLRWAALSLNPPEIGSFKEVTYEGMDPAGKGARPIVALAVDADGFIYGASAYDPGTDDGPFRSVV